VRGSNPSHLAACACVWNASWYPRYQLGRSAVKRLSNGVTIGMNPAQSRMARAALQLGVRDVASLAKVSPNTIARLERGESLYPRTVEAIRTALEAAGVVFTNGDEPGVKLRKADQ